MYLSVFEDRGVRGGAFELLDGTEAFGLVGITVGRLGKYHPACAQKVPAPQSSLVPEDMKLHIDRYLKGRLKSGKVAEKGVPGTGGACDAEIYFARGI